MKSDVILWNNQNNEVSFKCGTFKVEDFLNFEFLFASSVVANYIFFLF